jgi:ABC-type multidrug transport system ATPase subunit
LINFEDIPPCPDCGEHFDNIFEATDHLLEDDEEEFDPIFVLPNGYSLMVGSLLRCLYSYADEPNKIKRITSHTYATLHAAEMKPSEVKHIIEDMVVAEQMDNIDEEIKKLLSRKKKNDN